ncbi:hypothetical protein [Brevibacillus brevis]|uniref:hypothetical protein n=1 Tax=Brevibacillus brevis TaxID=1393 RepID=UPI00034B4240|nr:hypothetical protein [Brevibacillus brevis]
MAARRSQGKELAPHGYVGNPAGYEQALAAAPDFIECFAIFASRGILSYLYPKHC